MHEGVCSWFEAGLSRQARNGSFQVAGANDYETRSSQPKPYEYECFHLQRNRYAGKDLESYSIKMGLESPLLRSMKAGDIVGLVACAHYQEWEDFVHEARIEIWSFDDLKDEDDTED